MAASREAAAAIRVRFGRGDAVRYKTPIEPVTEADMVADRILSARLRRRFPEDGWLSEEGVDSSDRLGRRRVWIVDPLDGTREFITGRPEFCVSVALVEDGQVVVGVVVNPVTGDRWAARLGCGATLNGRPIHVRECNDLQGGPIVVSRSELTRGVLEPWRSLPLHPAGGMANKLVLVAMGSAVATFTPRMRHEWDLVSS